MLLHTQHYRLHVDYSNLSTKLYPDIVHVFLFYFILLYYLILFCIAQYSCIFDAILLIYYLFYVVAIKYYGVM